MNGQCGGRLARVLLGSIATAIALLLCLGFRSFGFDTIYAGRVTAQSSGGEARLAFTEPYFLASTIAYVVVSGWHVIFNNNENHEIHELTVRQQKVAAGGWEWSNGEHAVTAQGEVQGWFYVRFVDDSGNNAFTVTIDYLVLGNSKLPRLGRDPTKYYVNFLGTGEASGTSNGGGGVAAIAGTGFEPGSTVFVALLGWELQFANNQDHQIHEIGMRPQNAVLGGMEWSGGLLVREDGTFGGQYWTCFDDDHDDDPYRFTMRYALIGMVGPYWAPVKWGIWPTAASGATGATAGLAVASAEFQSSGFSAGFPGVFPLLAGWQFVVHQHIAYIVSSFIVYETQNNIHELQVRLQKPVFGGWEFANQLPVLAGGQVRGKYWVALNDNSDSEDFDFTVRYVLVGY